MCAHGLHCPAAFSGGTRADNLPWLLRLRGGGPARVVAAAPLGARGEDDVAERRAAAGPGRAEGALVGGVGRADAVERRRGKVELREGRERAKHRREADEEALRGEEQSKTRAGATAAAKRAGYSRCRT